MSFRALLYAYLLGGLTFLPLLIAAVAAAAWYLLPRVNTLRGDEAVGDLFETEEKLSSSEKETLEKKSRLRSNTEAAASGTFAVLRRYDFQGAIGAFGAKNSGNTQVGLDSRQNADGGAGTSSESVYQSMYRSVFVGSKNAGTSSLLEVDDGASLPGARRRPVPAHVMYIVLRHGHLLLYDSPAQVEVKHVLSLAHHEVSLQSGNHGDDDLDETRIPEADLFIKRTAIVLTPVELPGGALQQVSTATPSNPFYLFSTTCIEKEDFYHALLAARTRPPTPRLLDNDALIKLQSTLHSSSLTPETRALNALIGRVFLGIHKTDVLVDLVRNKISRKLARIQKPTFIPHLHLRTLNLGDAGPVFSNLKLRDLNIDGDLTLAADMRYNGALSITLLAVAKLDLGPRFKTRTVDLVLKTSVQRISGTMLLHVKPPPSNRLWFCFESMPDLEVRVEPLVSERKITYGFVLRAIEERLRTAISEGLVKPNWDDVPMPLQDTRGSHARGGLWTDEGEKFNSQLWPGTVQGLADGNEKTMSTPDLPRGQNTGTSTGIAPDSEANIPKVRHAATMPVDSQRPADSTPLYTPELGSSPDRSQNSPRPPKPLRSPSTSASPASVAMDGQSVEPVPAEVAAKLAAQSQGRRFWRSREAAKGQQAQRDAIGELRGLRDRVEQASAKPGTSTLEADSDADPGDSTDPNDTASIRSHTMPDDFEPFSAATPRVMSTRSTISDRSAGGSPASATRSQQFQQRKSNLLTAAATATTAARKWGWDTIQKNKGALQRSSGSAQSPLPSSAKEPMGRGQPLPPPGVPLPGPQRGVWETVGSLRRKPLPALPPRRSVGGSEMSTSSVDTLTKHETRDTGSLRSASGAEDEFGTWQENSGAGEDQGTPESSNTSSISLLAEKRPSEDETHEQDQPAPSISREADLIQLSADDDEDEDAKLTRNSSAGVETKAPPPLPARRPRTIEAQASEASANADFEDGSKAVYDNGQEHLAEASDQDRGGIRVPDYAARAVTVENSTTELQQGARDAVNNIDASRGVGAESLASGQKKTSNQ